MRIRKKSYRSAEESKNKIKNDKSSWIRIVTLINALFLLFGFLCWTGTCFRNKALNEYKEGYEYLVQEDRVSLDLGDGVNVELRFGKSSVLIKDAYRVSTTKEQAKIILFIGSYLRKEGKQLTRSNTDCLGEYRLHCELYKQGYEQARTKDVDLEYDNDPRWYVNLCSRIIGWTGI